MSTRIPAQWAAQGIAIPTVCARHGMPEARRQRTEISQATPGWMYLLLLIGVVVFFLARTVALSSVGAAQWPYCEQCVKRRRAVFLGAGAAVAVGLALFPLAFLMDLPALIVLGLLVVVAGIVAFDWGTWSRLSSARMTDHTAWIEVPAAHPEFARQFEALRGGHAEATATPTMTAPQPIIKKLNPLWYIVLVVGIGLAITGVINFMSGPTCGPEVMRPGDVCETTTSTGAVAETTYEQERSSANGLAVAGVAGAVIALGAGIRIRRWNRALRRAWAAHQQGQPTSS